MQIIKSPKIYIYENLPYGGAAVIHNSLIQDIIHNRIPINIISDKEIRPNNFVSYLYSALITTTFKHRDIANKIDKNGVLVAHHSWLTKSPHLLRYYQGRKIYICQEVMREYYDPEHIKLHDLKDLIVNILRSPIKYLDKLNVYASNIIVANSYRSATLIKKAYGKSSVVIYPGIEIPNRIHKQKPSNQVITIGYLNKYKNILFLVKVIAEIEEKKRPTLSIVANGYDKSYRDKLIKYAKKHNVKIKISISITRQTLQAELAKSQLFLYSPISEPFGIVILEAMAAGLPLLVDKRGGGYSEILSEKNGVLMNNNNPSEWALILTRMLQNTTQLNKYRQYNQNYIKNFTNEIMSKKIFTLISQQIQFLNTSI